MPAGRVDFTGTLRVRVKPGRSHVVPVGAERDELDLARQVRAEGGEPEVVGTQCQRKWVVPWNILVEEPEHRRERRVVLRLNLPPLEVPDRTVVGPGEHLQAG